MKLLDRLRAKIVLPQDILKLKGRKLYIRRTYAGKNQKASGAFSGVVLDDNDAIFEIGFYEPLSEIVKNKMVVIYDGSFAFHEMVLDGFNECRHCPYWKKINKYCSLDRNPIDGKLPCVKTGNHETI